jgi:hypothetical protein
VKKIVGGGDADATGGVFRSVGVPIDGRTIPFVASAGTPTNRPRDADATEVLLSQLTKINA